MKFLILSEAGDFSALALKMKDAGDEVWTWTKNKRFASENGLTTQVPTVEVGIDKGPQCVIADSVGMGAICDSLRKKGLHVFGGGLIQDKMETDRAFAMKLAKECGLSMPAYVEFKKTQIEQAIAFVKKTKKRYVLKPIGKEWSNLTYGAQDAEDMIGFLDYIKVSDALIGDFLLQEFIDGIELATNIHFHDGDPIFPADQTIERKKFMNGDIGPSTGCSASVLWFCKTDHPKIVQQTFDKMFKWLKQQRYTGALDINTIVNEKGAWFLEFTPRFGYSSHYCWFTMATRNIGETLFGMASGQLKRIEPVHPMSFCSRVSIPPYPLDPYDRDNFKIFDKSAGHAVSGFPDKNAFLLDVKQEKHGLVTGGQDGLILEMVNAGSSLDELEKSVYKAIEHTRLADKQYRTDGAEKARKNWPLLKKMGYEVPI